MAGYELKVVSIRLVEDPPWRSGTNLDSPAAIAGFLSKELSSFDRELFCILNMSTKNQVINMNIVSMGTLNESLAHPREVFKSAILSNASSVVLVHNHPSGICEPSQADIQITKRLEDSGKILGITVLDHIITGQAGHYFSFKEENILPIKDSSLPLVADPKVPGRSR